MSTYSYIMINIFKREQIVEFAHLFVKLPEGATLCNCDLGFQILQYMFVFSYYTIIISFLLHINMKYKMSLENFNILQKSVKNCLQPCCFSGN